MDHDDDGYDGEDDEDDDKVDESDTDAISEDSTRQGDIEQLPPLA